jgi:hypothetical protein
MTMLLLHFLFLWKHRWQRSLHLALLLEKKIKISSISYEERYFPHLVGILWREIEACGYVLQLIFFLLYSHRGSWWKTKIYLTSGYSLVFLDQHLFRTFFFFNIKGNQNVILSLLFYLGIYSFPFEERQMVLVFT